MIKMILKWFTHTTAFKIIVAFFIAGVILIVVGQILSIIFRLIKKEIIRVVVCIGASVISAHNCLQYSKWACLPVLFVVIWAIVGSKEEKKILARADGVKYATSKEFVANSVDMWGYLLTFALIEPVLSCLNSIVCSQYGIDTIEWFRFCWTFEQGIFQYAVIRYTIALMPWFLLIMTYIPINDLKEKEWLIDLEESEQNEVIQQEAENKRILKMNPDAGVEMKNPIEERDSSGKTQDYTQITEDENEKADSILNDISKFL